MQKFYTMNLYAALMACGGLALWLVFAILSPLVIDSRISLLPEVAIFLAFLLLNLFFYGRNKERRLRLPQFVSERATKICSAATFCLFLTIMAYGLHSYPYAPWPGAIVNRRQNRLHVAQQFFVNGFFDAGEVGFDFAHARHADKSCRDARIAR